MAVAHRNNLDYVQQLAVDLYLLQKDIVTGDYDLRLFKERAIVGDDWMTNYLSFESGRLISLNYVPELTDYRYNMIRSCGWNEFYSDGFCTPCENK